MRYEPGTTHTVYYPPRWWCDDGHRHRSQVAAERCEAKAQRRRAKEAP